MPLMASDSERPKGSKPLEAATWLKREKKSRDASGKMRTSSCARREETTSPLLVAKARALVAMGLDQGLEVQPVPLPPRARGNHSSHNDHTVGGKATMRTTRRRSTPECSGGIVPQPQSTNGTPSPRKAYEQSELHHTTRVQSEECSARQRSGEISVTPDTRGLEHGKGASATVRWELGGTTARMQRKRKSSAPSPKRGPTTSAARPDSCA